MFTYNTIEVENFKFNNHQHRKFGDPSNTNVNEQSNIPNYHNVHNNNNLRNNQNINYHNSEISRRYHIDSRPTYGAYIHNTLPRGPYLQYKFNDYKQFHNGCINKNDKLLSLSIPQLSSQSLSSSSTMTINDNNHSNNSDHYRINHNDLHNIDNIWPNNTHCNQRQQTQTLGRYKNNYFTTANDIFYNRSPHTTQMIRGNLKMPRPSSSRTHNDLPNVTNMHARCVSTSYADDLRKENASRQRKDDGKRLKYLNEIGNRNGIVITESCYENELKLNMNKKTSTVISGKRITASDHIKSASNNGIYSYGSYNVNKKSISNHKNYVTLHDVLNVKTTGLNQNEGWALLCQSIQALQDLFLSDSHSLTRILPLINPSNLQITSRGRIALNLMPAEHERHESNIMLQHINGSPFKDIMDYLSPEYIKNIDQNKIYSISDIEKMWIYSLGITLEKTLQNSSDMGFYPDKNYTNTINEKRYKSSLDFVIASMRERNINQRASLMYLLDIISEYCKTNNQHKPFSHIIIELFNEAITKNEISTYPSYSIDPPVQRPQSNEQRSDVPRNTLQRNSDLKVIRINSNENLHPDQLYKTQPALAEKNVANVKSAEVGPKVATQQLQVVRKRTDILKKRKDTRRNTIHGTKVDVETANKLYLENNLANHKSSEVLNNIHGKNIFNSASEVNFENTKALTLPNLKIRRYNLNQNAANKSTHNHGPEFILNSNLPVKVVNLVDEKSVNRRLVNVLLLNGHQLHIYCHCTNTTTYQLLETIVKLENIVDNFFLGLCTLIGGDFVFLPKELKISKIAPTTWLQSTNKLNISDTDLPLNLFLRIKFFVPKFRGSETLNSSNFLYFQLRKSILERQILCTEDDLITLGGLALQAEVGDFEENMKYVEYFTISHYLPEEVYRKNKELARYIRNSHLCKKGLRPSEARENFIRFVQELKEYGLHLYTAKWIKDKQPLDIFLAISLSGICIFERNSMSLLIDPNTNSKTTYQRKIYETFDWMEIQNLNFSKHLLGINVKKNLGDGNRCTTTKFKFKLCDKKSYFAFTLASEHHKFCLKLRKSFHSLKPLADELNIPVANSKTSSDESSPKKLKQNEKSRSEPSLSQAFDDAIKPKPNDKMNRFKNIKISMQNDNRLKKIKNKLLRRSNSFTENGDKENPSESTKNNKKENKLTTKEENQNRENECPRVTIVEQSKTLKSQCNTMNRNKVKMGTRVFSPHFLSKSVDNILNSTDLKPLNSSSFKCNKINETLYEETCSLINLNTLHTSNNPLAQLKHQHPTVIHSSIPTIYGYNKGIMSSDGNRSRSNGNFTLQNESISETLLEKFNNISCSKTGDRVIKTVFIKKDPVPNIPKQRTTTILSKLTRYSPFKQADNTENLDDVEPKPERYTLGISIIEGKDNNVYVKDLITNGPGERSGIKIGDQILAVNGISLFHVPYSEALKFLQTTEIDVKLTVAQLIANHVDSVRAVHSDNNMTITSQERLTNRNNYHWDSYPAQESSALNIGLNYDSNPINGFSKYTSMNDCQNIISKRTLNLPKVISSSPERYNEKINKHSRRFDGHITYPVTPAKLNYV